jgi:hypothetical protein
MFVFRWWKVCALLLYLEGVFAEYGPLGWHVCFRTSVMELCSVLIYSDCFLGKSPISLAFVYNLSPAFCDFLIVTGCWQFDYISLNSFPNFIYD